MYYIRYYHNPIQPHDAQHQGRIYYGKKLLAHGIKTLIRGQKHPDMNINVIKNVKSAIHGLSYVYDFNYNQFKKRNFKLLNHPVNGNLEHTVTDIYIGKHKCTERTWNTILLEIIKELKTVRLYSTLKGVHNSTVGPYIELSHAERYYHPAHIKSAKHYRKKLAELGNGKRYRFTGTYQRFGSKSTSHQLTILLTNITHNHEYMTDHQWFNATKQFRSLGDLEPGDRISFNARVSKYTKGYLPGSFAPRYDYELGYPTKIKLYPKGPRKQ